MQLQCSGQAAIHFTIHFALLSLTREQRHVNKEDGRFYRAFLRSTLARTMPQWRNRQNDYTKAILQKSTRFFSPSWEILYIEKNHYTALYKVVKRRLYFLLDFCRAKKREKIYSLLAGALQESKNNDARNVSHRTNATTNDVIGEKKKCCNEKIKIHKQIIGLRPSDCEMLTLWIYCCTRSRNPHTSKFTFTNLYEHIIGDSVSCELQTYISIKQRFRWREVQKQKLRPNFSITARIVMALCKNSRCKFFCLVIELKYGIINQSQPPHKAAPRCKNQENTAAHNGLKENDSRSSKIRRQNIAKMNVASLRYMWKFS